MFDENDIDIDFIPFDQASCFDSASRYQKNVWNKTKGKEFDMMIKSLIYEYEVNGGYYEKALDTVIGEEEV